MNIVSYLPMSTGLPYIQAALSVVCRHTSVLSIHTGGHAHTLERFGMNALCQVTISMEPQRFGKKSPVPSPLHNTGGVKQTAKHNHKTKQLR